MKLFDIFKEKVTVDLIVPEGYAILKNGIGEYKWECIKTQKSSADYSYDMFKSYDEAVIDLIEHVDRVERNKLREVWVKLDKKS